MEDIYFCLKFFISTASFLTSVIICKHLRYYLKFWIIIQKIRKKENKKRREKKNSNSEKKDFQK